MYNEVIKVNYIISKTFDKVKQMIVKGEEPYQVKTSQQKYKPLRRKDKNRFCFAKSFLENNSSKKNNSWKGAI